MGTHSAPRDPLAELLADLRALLAEVFGPPAGLMQIIPPDGLARCARDARPPYHVSVEAAARYMAAQAVAAGLPWSAAEGAYTAWPEGGARTGLGDPTGDPPVGQ